MLDQAESLRMLAKEKTEEKVVKNPKEKAARIITVTSGKGGVGKSNFVVNLGITLQKMGKSVLVFDADVGMGNDDVLMGFLPRYNIYDIIYNNKDIEDVIIEGPYGIKLLPGGTGLNKIDEIEEEERGIFINKLGTLKDFDFIIMDTGAGINKNVLAFIQCCDDLIVLTTPEPTALTDAYSLVKAVSHFKIKSSAKVVINRVIEYKEGRDTFRKFNNAAEKFLEINLEYLGNISEDIKLIQSVRKQKPFVINFPNCSAALDIEEIALKLCGDNKVKTENGIQGLFKRLFNVFS